jgi:hypothetical protein
VTCPKSETGVAAASRVHVRKLQTCRAGQNQHLSSLLTVDLSGLLIPRLSRIYKNHRSFSITVSLPSSAHLASPLNCFATMSQTAAYGRTGMPVRVTTNSYEILTLPRVPFYQYDCRFEHVLIKGDRSLTVLSPP